MFGLTEVVEIIDTPIEKVQRSLQSVVYKEIRKHRMSNLRGNLINQPTFIGIAPKLGLIDPEEEVKTFEDTHAAQVVFADMGDR